MEKYPEDNEGHHGQTHHTPDNIEGGVAIPTLLGRYGQGLVKVEHVVLGAREVPGSWDRPDLFLRVYFATLDLFFCFVDLHVCRIQDLFLLYSFLGVWGRPDEALVTLVAAVNVDGLDSPESISAVRANLEDVELHCAGHHWRLRDPFWSQTLS